MYSLTVTAKMNDIDPPAWLADVLAAIAGHPARDMTTCCRGTPAATLRPERRLPA
jgi:hypothetical protein